MPTKSPTEPPAPPVAAKPEPSVKAFANGDVVALVKAGLDDGIVIAKIEQDPGTGLDVSTEALVKLKKQGVSSKVIQAIVKRAGNARQTQASVESAESRPAPSGSRTSSSGHRSGTPTESDGRRVFENLTPGRAKANVQVVRFRKTNGQMSEVFGVKHYTLEYEVELNCPAGTIFWESPDLENPAHFSGLGIRAAQEQFNFFQRQFRCSSENFKRSGTLAFEQTERGWRGQDGKLY